MHRSIVTAFVVIAALATGASAEAQPRDRMHLEVIVGGERHFASFIAERPPDLGGGEERRAGRFWSGGFDLCPAAVITRWLDLGGCVGVHVVTQAGTDPELDWTIADQSLILLGRVMARAVFRAPRFLRGGLDLGYRSFVAQGRESAVELSLRLGVEHTTRGDLPLFLELVWRAPLIRTRSDSRYVWPPVDDGDTGFPGATRDVRIFSFGLQAGGYWRIR